jgi:hypothetical protein
MAQKALRAGVDFKIYLMQDTIHGACSMDQKLVGISAFTDNNDKIISVLHETL